jgi:hypothetical protein
LNARLLIVPGNAASATFDFTTYGLGLFDAQFRIATRPGLAPLRIFEQRFAEQLDHARAGIVAIGDEVFVQGSLKKVGPKLIRVEASSGRVIETLDSIRAPQLAVAADRVFLGSPYGLFHAPIGDDDFETIEVTNLAGLTAIGGRVLARHTEQEGDWVSKLSWWDAATQQIQATIPLDVADWSAIRPTRIDEKRVLVSQGAGVRLVDLDAASVTGSIDFPGQGFLAAAVTGESVVVLTSDDDEQSYARALDRETLAEVSNCPSPGESARVVYMLRDTLVFGGLDGLHSFTWEP